MLKRFFIASAAWMSAISYSVATWDPLLSPFWDNACPTCPSCWVQTLNLDVGWRRDNLTWKLKDLKSDDISGKVKDHINFRDINSYTVAFQWKWFSPDYYVRLSGEYGGSHNGRMHEHFKINSPVFFGPITVETNDPIRRRSELYDIDGAIGYPFAFFDCRLSVVPLLGFSYHQQKLDVKMPEDYSSYGYYGYYGKGLRRRQHLRQSLNNSSSSSSFAVARDNPFVGFPESDPFSDSSDPTIAKALGLINFEETSHYRFTWYGLYLGADVAFAVDDRWSLFWYTEFHAFNSCHRKRKSLTGVDFVDDYHKKGYAYGFNNTLGVNCHICGFWYGVMVMEGNWWHTNSTTKDQLEWDKVGAKIGITNAF